VVILRKRSVTAGDKPLDLSEEIFGEPVAPSGKRLSVCITRGDGP
jgi:hypothetical protein